MSATATREGCLHAPLGMSRQSGTAVQCSDCYAIFKGEKRLTSVSRIIGVIPQEPCSQCHWPIYSDHQPGCSVKANIDNANRRGKEVDGMFSAWVLGKLDRIPVGVGEDSKALFYKLTAWFDNQNFSEVESQVLVADDEVGGVLDLRLDGIIVDLKCTYDVSLSHKIQVGGYVSLDRYMNGPHIVRQAAILHCTERFKEPKLFHLNPERIVSQFQICLTMYRMLKEQS